MTLLPLPLLAVLDSTRDFATVDSLVDRIGVALQTTAAAAKEITDEWIVLVSQVSAYVPPATAVVRKIETFGVMTRDRPEALARCLHSFSSVLRNHDVTATI